MDIRKHNSKAWDKWVEDGNQYTVPVSSESIEQAGRGDWNIRLTPTKPVPHVWLPDLPGKKVLCLASGGGQQGPILAAAGADVTVFDNSPKQLERDRYMAEREDLTIATVEGDMRDLNTFPDATFDYIVHPVSNAFVPDVQPVWRESFRVLRPGGIVVAGFGNPAVYLFDYEEVERSGKLIVTYKLPYADPDVLMNEEKARYEKECIAFEFSHTLDDLIGGQLDAGFVLVGFYEDNEAEAGINPLENYMATYIATRAQKPR